MPAKLAALTHQQFTCRVVAGLLLALFVAQAPLAASTKDLQDQEARIEQVRERLRALQKSVRKDKTRASAASNKLRKTEQAIAALTQQLASLDGKLKSQNKRLEELRDKHRKERKRMDQLQTTLTTHVRSAYATGRQGQLKLLLSQEDPATVSRVLTYFRFLSEARAEGIKTAADQLLMLEKLKTEISRQRKALETLKAERQQESQNLKRTRSARKEALAALKGEIGRKGQEMEQLKKDEHQLQQLIDTLNEELAAAPSELEDQLPFTKRKGHMQWPVAGRLVTRFGQTRKVGQLKWRGVLISATEGSDVHAVSHGQVVFADWFRGFGLLIILEHGDGYMSLYGYNQSLHKEVGDWVSSGELISSVGVSGGQRAPGLYFELRHRGRPVNPMAWFEGLPAKLRASR
jgi:septal ring factor EnvC (AmiA/AmiB activator)